MALSRPTKRAKSGVLREEPKFNSVEEEEQALLLARVAKNVEAKSRGEENHAALAKRQPKDLDQKPGVGKSGKTKETVDNPKYLTKAERTAAALARLEERRQASQPAARQKQPSSRDNNRDRREDHRRAGAISLSSSNRSEDREKEKEKQMIRDHYLGKKAVKKKVVKPSEKFAKIFQFDWEATDDTSQDLNPLYQQKMTLNPLFGRGYIAGLDMQEQRRSNAFNQTLIEKRQAEERQAELEDQTLSKNDLRDRERARRRAAAELKEIEKERNTKLEKSSIGLKGKHWSDKTNAEMNVRDWRIFREDFDIVVKGGRAPLPLREWKDGNLPEEIMRAIKDLKYVQPSPIQRQAIPIGLEWRDIIGIAETGSGKTCAFVVPLLCYIMDLPDDRREKTAEDGPLALIMAPTRELAQQIEGETKRISEHLGYKTVSVVGGQSIQDQGFYLREGVEVVIGTPGRLKDAIESSYMVLNQCNYVVLDEADRMVDMGFETDVNFVLDAMGGTLKSEFEEEAYKQEAMAKRGEALFRVTCMFSATMPAAVERLAKMYLRHPAIVSIGDRDGSKNKRIEQVVIMVSESQKPNHLLTCARPKSGDDKVIVFVNEKKRCDMVARSLEKSGIRCSILHGGKTQDQREQSLEYFRTGAFQVLVATDVAGRGLDIPDVSQVINYDMPNKIENYCHRIGRTGRAGKEGLATTFITEGDDEVMFDLKAYLESTDAVVPPGLARHPSAQHPPGAVGADGRSLTRKRDTVIHSNR